MIKISDQNKIGPLTNIGPTFAVDSHRSHEMQTIALTFARVNYFGAFDNTELVFDETKGAKQSERGE